MWTCPKCNRNFKTTNQSHSCNQRTLEDIFENRPDHLLLAFDTIMQTVMEWKPNSLGIAVHSAVFTNKKAWLIVKPLKKVLDVKFYYNSPIESDSFHKIQEYNGKFSHHYRIAHEEQLDQSFFEQLRRGFEYGMA
jgi:hypothetical protein